MKVRSSLPVLLSTCALALAWLLAGCGGGGGGGSVTKTSATSQAVAEARLVATTRLSRSVLAVSGLGRTITRAAAAGAGGYSYTPFGRRIPLFFGIGSTANGIITVARSATLLTPTLDPGTGLYYITTVNADGSGQQLLYLDIKMTQPAGSFTWSAPQWTNPTTKSYPAIITVIYNITAGSYAGVSGTMTITVNDPKFTTGLIHLALKDSLNESSNSSLNVTTDGVSGQNQVVLSDGTGCFGTIATTAAGVLDEVYTWTDGSSVDINTNPDGSSSETYSNPDATGATSDLSGAVQSDGTDTISNGDGTTDTVNVDPGSSDSGDSSGDNSSQLSKKAKLSTGSTSPPPAPTARRP